MWCGFQGDLQMQIWMFKVRVQVCAINKQSQDATLNFLYLEEAL